MALRRQVQPGLDGIRSATGRDDSAPQSVASPAESTPSKSRAISVPVPTPPESLPGLVFDGRYRIERELGSGGMAQVYLGTYLRTGVKVAIKLLDPSLSNDPASQRRCIDEARAMMELQSSHIVRAIDVGTLPSGQLYIVMEYLEGEDLNALLIREGPLTWPHVGDIAIQVCSGLATAHRRGIIHRDIKPQNCFRVTVDDNPEHIKIIDFGVARDLAGDAGPTQNGFIIGTPEYTAPELVMGRAKANPQTDVYALGIMLYKLLTGVVPFQGPTPLETLHKHVNAPLTPPSRMAPYLDIPPIADDIICHALARDPSERFAGADDLSRAIKAALGLPRSGLITQPVEATPGPQPEPPAAPEPEARPPAEPIRSTSAAPAPREGRASPERARRPVATPSRERPGPPASGAERPDAQVRPVDRTTTALRLASLVSLSVLFVVGTKLVTPAERTRDAGDRAREPIEARESPGPAPRSAAVHDRPEASPTEEPSGTPPDPRPGSVVLRGVPTDPPSPAEDDDLKPPGPDQPRPDAAETAVDGAAATDGAPTPEALFNYRGARLLLDEQADYFRKTCLARAGHPTTRLKLRVDVRPSGHPVVKVFSSERAIRGCVRDVMVFPFDPSPRGGAFIYTLTEAGGSLQKVPLSLEAAK